jgi:predicted metal-dependent hydrolase
MLSTINKGGIAIEIKKSKLAKRQRIVVSNEGVKVTVPYNMPITLANKFVENNLAWIEKKLKEIVQRSSYKQKIVLKDGEKITIFGDTLEVKISTAPKNFIEISDNFLLVNTKDEQKIKPYFINFLKQQLEYYLDFKIGLYAKALNLYPKRITIKQQKTLWGSCSQRGNLNFNLNLIFCEKQLIDYVIVHELCHLKHMNHSKKFWQLVESQIKDYAQKRKRLKASNISIL